MTWTVADTAQTLSQRFEEQARLRPEAQAIGGTAWAPTYSELDAAANGIAHALLDRSRRAGRVALLARHDAPLFAAAIGALKAGKTVVVLNPADPPARLGRIRADVEPELVLVDAAHRELALGAGFEPGEVVDVAERPAGSPRAGPDAAARPDDPAFVIYTSGSTGAPKGVVQTHRNMLHNVLRHTNGLGIRPDDRVVLLASPSGGQGVGTTWTALLNGATLCPFPLMERGVTGLAEWLAEQRVTVFVASASVFRSFVRTLGDRRVPGVRLVRLGSEPAFQADFEAYRRHFPDAAALANTLSSSETGNITQCLMGPAAAPPDGGLPVGTAAEGIELLLLDEAGAEVAPGETGEIVVRSRYLSPGYWRDEASTAKRFVREGANGGPRRFHTGDLARRSSDGTADRGGPPRLPGQGARLPRRAVGGRAGPDGPARSGPRKRRRTRGGGRRDKPDRLRGARATRARRPQAPGRVARLASSPRGADGLRLPRGAAAHEPRQGGPGGAGADRARGRARPSPNGLRRARPRSSWPGSGLRRSASNGWAGTAASSSWGATRSAPPWSRRECTTPSAWR